MRLGIATTFIAPALWAALGAPAAQASVAVAFAPDTTLVQVGQTVDVQIQLSSALPASVAAAEIIFAWDPSELRLLGLSSTGGADLLASGFPTSDPYGLNEAAVPADGDAYYLALARLGLPLPVSEEGESVLLTTLVFEALAPTAATEISILAHAGTPPGHTRVFDGLTPNTDITGALSGAVITIIPAPAAGWLGPAAAATVLARRRRRA